VIAEGADTIAVCRAVERLGRVLSAIPMNAAVRSWLKRWQIAALTAQSRGKDSRRAAGGDARASRAWAPRVEPDEYRAFRDAVRPGMTALDVGANVGAYALLLGHLSAPPGPSTLSNPRRRCSTVSPRI
jgi:hypothetical protein